MKPRGRGLPKQKEGANFAPSLARETYAIKPLPAGLSAVPGGHRKIGSAPVVNPNSVPVRAPTIAFGARGVAVLRHQTHFAASRIHGAGVLSHVVRLACNRLRLRVFAVLAIADLIPVIPVPTRGEISPASVVYPHTLIVKAPAMTFGASIVAVLRQQPHSASRIHGAGVSFPIVRVACHRSRLPPVSAVLPVSTGLPISAILIVADLIPVIPVATDGEISPASVVYPDALVVRAPAGTFGASGVAELRE